MKELCRKIITTKLEDFICQERLGEVLELIARFPHINFENILLLLHQLPEATLICGKGAWHHLHGTIRENAKPIALLTPTIVTTDLEKQKHTSYTVVPVYDISQVILEQNSSDFLKKENLPNNRVEQVLKEQYHFCILEDFEEVYVGRNRMIKSKYNEELHQIFLRPGLSNQTREVELLKYYIRMKLKEKHIVSYTMELEHYIKIVLSKYFSIQGIDTSIRATEFFFCTKEEKLEYFQQLSNIVFSSILELTKKRTLNFIQTMCCTLFLESEDRNEMIATITMAIELAEEESLQRELRYFLEWIKNLSLEDASYIRQKRLQQTLFTFPFVTLPMKP